MFSFCSNLGSHSEPNRCCLSLPKTRTMMRTMMRNMMCNMARNNALKSLRNYAAS